jgi:acetyltransferase-like isoleucine patch superfamily enzyme
MITLNKTIVGMPNHPGTSTAINNWGKIIFHGKCQIYTFNKINVSKKGILEFGDGTRIMCMVNITAHNSVRIGAQSWIVHRCQVMDSNYHFIADFKKGRINKYFKPVEIGDYCWICNSTTITGGAVIPNKTIVASNSLVNKDLSDLPENSIIGGMPAKFIKTGYRRIESMKLLRAVSVYFSENPEEKYYTLMADEDGSSCNVD